MGVGPGPGSLIREAKYEQRADQQLADLRRRFSRGVDEVMRVVEWGLARTPDFANYPVIGTAGAFGLIRATRTERAGGLPAMVILFSVAEDNQSFSVYAVNLANEIE